MVEFTDEEKVEIIVVVRAEGMSEKFFVAVFCREFPTTGRLFVGCEMIPGARGPPCILGSCLSTLVHDIRGG